MHDQDEPQGMSPAEVNMLLAFAATQDPYMQNEESTFETWCHNLRHIPYDDAKVAVMEYYGKSQDSEFRQSVTAAHIRKLYRSRKDLEESKARLLEPPKPKPGRMYRDTLLRAQQRGHWLDRNPEDYPERPTGADPTRERHP